MDEGNILFCGRVSLFLPFRFLFFFKSYLLLFSSVVNDGQIFSFGSLLVEYGNGAFEIHYDNFYLSVPNTFLYWNYLCLIINDGMFDVYVNNIILNTID